MLSIVNLTDSQETEHQSEVIPIAPQRSKICDQILTEAPSSDPVMMEIDTAEEDPRAVEYLAEKPVPAIENELAEIQGKEQSKEGILMRMTNCCTTNN